jgi:hypothetical protein
MLAFLCSVGGFFVGGGAVYIYAKATDQEVEWRRIDIVRIAQRVIFGIHWRSKRV